MALLMRLIRRDLLTSIPGDRWINCWAWVYHARIIYILAEHCGRAAGLPVCERWTSVA